MAIPPKAVCVRHRPPDAFQALLRVKDKGRNLIIPKCPAGYLVMVVGSCFKTRKIFSLGGAVLDGRAAIAGALIMPMER